jgi:predicted metal-dependent phosphoesterase TrpH
VIDLHLHTTASDGRSTPEELAREVAAAGVTVMAVTDHDTMAAVPAVRAAARALGVRVVPGVEITAVHGERDVHVLGYFLDAHHPALVTFLERQRVDRLRRLREMAARLAALGVPVDESAFVAAPDAPGKAFGRPMLAAALVAAGHVASIREAFDEYIGEGRPAYIERHGATPAEVVAIVAAAGGLASLAHPGKLGLDDMIPALVEAGLPAIEVFHTDHDADDVRRYLDFVERYQLLRTGGSDYHGPGSGRTTGLGRMHLPREDFDRLASRAGWRDDA